MSRTGFLILTVLLAVLVADRPACAVVLSPSNGGNPLLHAIGWQTFDNEVLGDNNSGIADTTPDSNSTFDDTPVGSHQAVTGGGVYLSGILGPGASILGWQGYGQSTNNGFLNGPTFGSSTVGSAPFGIDIEDVPLADGSAGARIGPQGDAGASSWKFRTDGNQEFGDFSITNESDYFFRLERIHFDARAGNANSPLDLDIIYLADSGNLVRVDNGLEVESNRVITSTTFDPLGVPSTQNITASLPTALSPETAVRLAPGETAAFRFRWTNSLTAFAESQIDNLAISGTFQDQNNSFIEIDPAAVVGGTFDAGDYNGDGVVDAADYALYRNNLGGSESVLAAGSRDASLAGQPLGVGDYEYWRSNYGGASGVVAGVVPESGSAGLLVTLLAALGLRRFGGRFYFCGAYATVPRSQR